jgi:O-antigen/teichoic acid export membrane protein
VTIPDESRSAHRRETRSVGRNVAALLLSQSVTWTLATFVFAIQPRFLGPEGQGQLRLGTSIWAIVGAIAAFGTTTWAIVETAKRPAFARDVLRNSVRLRLVVFSICAPLALGFSAAAGYTAEVVWIVAAFGVSALVTLVADAHSATLHGLQEMGRSARAEVVSKLVGTVATIAVLLAGGEVLALSGVSVAWAVLWFVLLRRALSGIDASLVPLSREGEPAPSGRALIAVTVPFLLADASLILYQQVDTIAMSLLVDENAIGWYSAADVLFGSLLFVPVILMTSLFPRLADLHENDPTTVPALITQAFRGLLLIATPIGLVTVVVAPSFVELLYGDEFTETGPVLQVFGVVVVLSCLTILLGRYALATGRATFWTALMVGAAAATVALDIVLVPWTDRRFDNGALGGALAYIVTESVMLVVGIAKLAPWLANRSTAQRAAKVFFAAGLAGVAAWPLRVHFFMLSATVAAAVFAATVVALRTLDDDERQQIARILARVRRGRTRARDTEELA